MSTSCNVRFIILSREKQTYPIANVYFHADGYPDGIGKDLCEWLMPKMLINGIHRWEKYDPIYANGFDDLVAQFVRDFKPNNVGDVYLKPMHAVGDCCYDIVYAEDHHNFLVMHGEYNVSTDEVLAIHVSDCHDEENRKLIFEGTLSGFLNYIRERN